VIVELKSILVDVVLSSPTKFLVVFDYTAFPSYDDRFFSSIDGDSYVVVPREIAHLDGVLISLDVTPAVFIGEEDGNDVRPTIRVYSCEAS